MKKDSILEKCEESVLLNFVENPFADSNQTEQVTVQVENTRDLWLLAKMFQDIRHEWRYLESGGMNLLVQ